MRAAGHVAVRQGGQRGTEPWRRYLEISVGRCCRPVTLTHLIARIQLRDPSFLYFAPMLVSVVAEKL